MFRFAQPQYLLLLLIIPLIIVMFAYALKRKRALLSKIGDIELMRQLMPDVSRRRGWLKTIIICIGFAFIIIGLARPQTGAKMRTQGKKGVEVMIALDVSNSMLARDFSPTRLDNAKLAISRLVDKMHDDRIGLIVFAGDAFVQLPITSDFAAAKIFLNTINTGIVPVQGTSLASAISLAMRSYTEASKKSRALIIISDGEDHEPGAVEAAKAAAENGIKIYCIGIGKTNGTAIQLPDGSFLKDSNGEIVTTKLNPEALQSVSSAGNGFYISATNVDLGLGKIIDAVHSMEKQEMTAPVFDEYREWFMYFLIIGLACIIAEIFILDRKNRWLNSIDIFRRKNHKISELEK